MATLAQIQAGIDALAVHKFSYCGRLTKVEFDTKTGAPLFVGCTSFYPESRQDFVKKMLARTKRCAKAEASWRKAGKKLDLLCTNPYAEFDQDTLAREAPTGDGFTGTLFAFDRSGPCGLADFSVGLDVLDFAPTRPQFFLRLERIFLSEDRRGEGIGAELAACAADAMLNVVTEVAQSITKRGMLELNFTSEVVSISGWLASWYAAAYLADRIGVQPGNGYAEGRLHSRPVTLECHLED